MADNLFPEDYEEESLTDEEIEEEVNNSEPVGYKQGIAFQFDENGVDIKRDGKNRIMTSTGVESWEQWCLRCIATEKDTSPYYSETFGIDTKSVFEAPTKELAETILASEITEGLLADPYGRTESVDEINIEWVDSDALKVNVVATGLDQATIDIETSIIAGMR